MMKKNRSRLKRIGLWAAAVAVTAGAVVFQRSTGPTHPEAVSFTLEGKEYTTRLQRSLTIVRDGAGGETVPLHIALAGLPEEARVDVYARRVPTGDDFRRIGASREGDRYTAPMPAQPPAGKMAYYLCVEAAGQRVFVRKDDPVVVRFKNDVPAGFLIPHILLMFAAMLLSNFAGLLAATGSDGFARYARLTLLCLAAGGLLLGPVIQKFAFGVYWSGWPLGADLTDNKTLVAFVVWLAALLAGRRRRRPAWGIAAAAIMLAIYCIPHSTLGSEHDYETGRLGTEKPVNILR